MAPCGAMSDLRRLLCPIDFSDASEGALRYALDLAGKLGSELHLVHAFQLSAYAAPDSDLAKGFRHDLERDLDALIHRHAGRGVVLHRHLRMGVPYVEIVAAARDLEIDLIVMGTTGKTGLEHFLLGSVAERIVRSAECPVLTVRHRPA